MRAGLRLGVVCLCAAAVVGPARAAEYVVVSGPGAGTILHSNPNGDVEPRFNQLNRAAGEVRPDMTFRGAVAGDHVEGPVRPFDELGTNALEEASIAITFAIVREQEALWDIRHGKLEFSRHADAFLDGALQRPVATQVATLLHRALKDDDTAHTALDREAAGQETKATATRIAITSIRRGLKAKAEAFVLMEKVTTPQPSQKVVLVDFGPGASTAISRNGLVTGYLGTPTQHNAFLGNGGTVFKLFQPPGGVGAVVLPDGTVGGQVQQKAAVWMPDGRVEPFPGLGGSTGPDNVIKTFNGSMWFGKSDNGAGVETPTQWTPDGNVGLVPGAPAVGEIFDASGKRLVGTFYSGQTFFGGLGNGGLFTNLGTPAGGSYSAAYTVNGVGIVGGAAWYPGNTNSTAELWRATTRTRRRPAGGGTSERHESLTPPSQDSFINSLNDNGWGFGAVGTPQAHHGAIFLWHHVYDVNSLIQGGSSLTITNVTDGNDAGQMSAIGRDANGVAHALLLTPVK